MFNKKIVEMTGKILRDRDAICYEDACELAHLPEDETIDLLFFAHKLKKATRKTS